jgi:hypothetical protein
MPLWAKIVAAVVAVPVVVIGGCTAMVAGSGLAQEAGDARPVISTDSPTYDPGINTPETKPTRAPKTTAPAPKVWKTIATLAGSQDKASDTIVTHGGRVRILYNVRGGDFVLVAAYLLEEGTDLEREGGIPDVTVQAAGRDSTIVRKDAGEYFLQVKAANARWSFTVQEES